MYIDRVYKNDEMRLGNLDLNTIHKGDCINLLKELPDNSIDLIFADPPYNLQLGGELFRPDQSKVDGVDDEWDKFQSKKEYDNFSEKWIKECFRVLKKNGSFWVIGSYHNIFSVGNIIQNTGFWILNDIIWVKSNPMPNFKGTRFNNSHETLIWSTKSKDSKYTFHYHSMKVMNEDLQMRSDWLIPICQGDERLKVDGKKVHSTQKPIELLYRILLSTSNRDDIVLDPFSGSGTTCSVAKLLGRKYIGFEREDFYIEHSLKRLETIKPIDKELTQYIVGKKKPKIPFGNLLEKGFIKIGEKLFSKNKQVFATVLADSSLQWGSECGSIHKISSKILNKDTNNGWTYWYVVRNDELISIDILRSEYEKKYIDDLSLKKPKLFEENLEISETNLLENGV